MFYCDLYGRVPPLSKQPPKTALCAVPAITLKLFVVIIRAINRQKARYLWLFASKWQSTVQVVLLQSKLESLQKQLKQRNNIKSDNSKGNSTANGTETVEWRVRVPKELDDDVQTFMNTFRFGEQMDMAQLLDNALSSYMMVEVSRKMREASRGLDMSESE